MRTLDFKNHNTNGLLITFCGLDGCGKSTMIKMLKEKIEALGVDVVLTKQPTDLVRKSDIFRRYMDTDDHAAYSYRALSLFAAADRIQHSNKVIFPELKNEKIVISDRYFYSCLANLRARGYTKDEWIYNIVADIPRPDLAFFLDVPVHIALERIKARPEERDRYIDIELQYRLKDEYKMICETNQGILIPSNDLPEITFEKIWEKVAEKLNSTKDVKNDCEIVEKVYGILNELSGTKPENNQVSLIEDLSLDSFRMVTLLIMIEECFGIELNESDMNPFNLITVGDVISLAKKYIT